MFIFRNAEGYIARERLGTPGLVHIQLLWLARLTTKKMPLFPLLLLWAVVTWGLVPLNSSSRLFWHFAFFSCHILFFVVWYIVGLRGCNQDWVFDCRFCLLVYQWSEWSVRILSWRFTKDLSDLAHHAWEYELIVVFLHHLPCVLWEQQSIDLRWCFPVIQIIQSYRPLFFGNGSIWSIILWWTLSMLLEDHLVRILKALKVFYLILNLVFVHF